jgi:hypothetical protein
MQGGGKNIPLKGVITLVTPPGSKGGKAQEETKILLENPKWNKKAK